MTKTRRLPIEGPALSRLRTLQEVAAKQEAFNHELLSLMGGTPSGFTLKAPQDISGGTTAGRGLETDGWAAGGHQHGLDTSGVPGAATLAASTQGSGPGVSLNGHTHQIAPGALYDPVTDPFAIALHG